jgi:hypothetical protein
VATAISRPNSPILLSLGYLKQVVFSNRPQTIENNEVAISNTSHEALKKVVRSMVPSRAYIVGTGSGAPEVPELPSAWGYSWATRRQGDINSGD